jgi:hypothetical protein
MLKHVLLAAALTGMVLPAVTFADDDDRGQQPPQCGYYANQYCANNQQGDDDRGERGRRHGNHGNQPCTNPAGNQRGWCNQNGYNGYNTNGGYYNGHNWVQYPNGQYNGQNPYGGYGQQQQRITGVISAINGSTITILHGLSAQSFDAQPAFSRGNVNGQLYPSRQITAIGVYDGNGYFHAYSIQ